MRYGTQVQLQSSLDETLAWNAAQRESIERLEAQLAQHATVDDAEMLQRELAKVSTVFSFFAFAFAFAGRLVRLG